MQILQKEFLHDRLINRLEKFLVFKRWGFNIAYMELQPNYVVVYNSTRCRIRCYLSVDKRDGEFIGISYGRSHAPNDSLYLDWQGEKQIAWHQFVIGYIGPFLDGIPPQEMAKTEKEQRYRYKSIAGELFEKSGESDMLKGTEWAMGFEGSVLNYYGDRLINLFDMRHPEYWEDYRCYLRGLYDELNKDSKQKEIYDNQPEWMPQPWQVC